jgi:tetratricopeptide (TPR) repeat protein
VNRPTERSREDSRYFLRFAGTAMLLVSGTLVMVLFVLPQRYVLSSGFREGSLVLPSPSTPFEPTFPNRIAAIPLPPPVDTTTVRGPAELLWATVLPLLNAERFEEALAHFEQYLLDFPGDRGVRAEYARTLIAAGYPDRAIPVLEELIEQRDDAELRLLLARTLRDVGRAEEAAAHYAVLVAASPDDETLRLEWGKALAWLERYESAERVLLEALEGHPDSLPLRVELARVYYSMGRLEEADAILSSLSEEELAAEDAIELRDDVRRALESPTVEVETPTPPTLLEQAIAARMDGDLDRAEALFREVLEANPDDADGWKAYADFLQYEREDFEGALEALKQVERITGGDDPVLQYRMAQLEAWTNRTDDARARLEALLPGLAAQGGALPSTDPQAEVTEPVLRADVYTLLGDISRWEGDRLAAVERYETALADDPDHEGAADGLAAVRADADRAILASEQPGLGAIASSLADTDDFMRVDFGGEWSGLRDDWVWSTRTGARFVEGVDLTGALSDEQGLFADFEAARWWRWGTIRTGLHGGVQTIRAGEVDAAIGASLRLVGAGGQRTDVRFDHEPAFGFANTLQAVSGNVRQDRLSAAHSRALGERWVSGVTAEISSMDHRGIEGADRNTRIQGSLQVARLLNREFSLGLAGRVLHYRDAAPTASGLPLYWDPDISVSVGPYVRYLRPLSELWEVDATVNPGIQWLQERRTTEGEVVPDLSARLGLTRDGATYRTSVAVFYGQGRFTGYRSYGLSVSFGARGLLGGGGR